MSSSSSSSSPPGPMLLCVSSSSSSSPLLRLAPVTLAVFGRENWEAARAKHVSLVPLVLYTAIGSSAHGTGIVPEAREIANIGGRGSDARSYACTMPSEEADAKIVVELSVGSESGEGRAISRESIALTLRQVSVITLPYRLFDLLTGLCVQLIQPQSRTQTFAQSRLVHYLRLLPHLADFLHTQIFSCPPPPRREGRERLGPLSSRGV